MCSRVVFLVLLSLGPCAHGNEENVTSTGILYEKCYTKYRNSILDQSGLKHCPYVGKRMGCYIKSNGGAKQYGCVTDLTETERNYCRSNVADCGICYADKCNAFSRIDKLCTNCTSTSDKNCFSLKENVAQKFCDDFTDKCYKFYDHRTKILIRGCFKEADKTVMDKCRKKSDANYECIFGTNQIDATDDTCFNCDSNIDPNCRHRPNATEEKICSLKSVAHRFDGCYYYKNGDRVKRGCVKDLQKDLSAEEFYECQNKTDKCHICKHKNCNIRNTIQQKCYSCDGSKDPKCATGEMNNITVCSDYAMSCHTGISRAGYTQRQCRSLDATDGKLRFTDIVPEKFCYEDLCNNELFPISRIKCFQCFGGRECKQLSSTMTPKVCAKLSLPPDNWEDACYTYIDDVGNTYRGCTNEMSEASVECLQNHQKCTKCELDGCNNQ